MNPKLAERLERIARRERQADVEEGRVVSFQVCRICGYASWVSSSEAGKGFQVALASEFFSSEAYCVRCTEAYKRAPEVCKWILGVIAHNEMMSGSEE